MNDKVKTAMKGFLGALGGALCTVGIMKGLDILDLGFVGHQNLGAGICVGFACLSLVVAAVLHIMFHELGHLVLGLCTGYRFISYRVFSVVFQKQQSGFCIKRYSIPGTLGQALMAPPKMKDGKVPYVWYNLGGAMFNFLLVGIALAINAASDAFIVRGFFTMSIVVGVFLGVVNIFPFSENGISDGCNLLKLHRHPDKVKFFYLQLSVAAQLADGKTWTDMDPEEFRIDESVEQIDSLSIIAFLYWINVSYCKRNFEEARKYVERIWEARNQLAPTYQNVIRLERLFLELIGNNDKQTVEELYTKEAQQFLKAMKFEVSTYRIQMAYEMFHNEDDVEALRYYKEGMEAALKAPYYGEAEVERGLLSYLKEKLENADDII